MKFINNNSNELNKKIMSMIPDKCIVVCDKSFCVTSITALAKKALSIDLFENIDVLISEPTKIALKLLIENKTEGKFFDTIDDVYYSITASYFENEILEDNIILLFEMISKNEQLSTLTMMFNYRLNEFLTSNINLMQKIDLDKNSEEYMLYKKDRFNLSRLVHYCWQTSQYYTQVNTNYYPYTTVDITKTIEEVIGYIKENIVGCDITFIKDKSIICDISISKIQLLIVNLVYNVFKHCSFNTKIIIKLELKNDNINITVKDFGKGIEENKLSNIFTAKPTSSYKDLLSSTLGLAVVSKIANAHSGVALISSTLGEGTTVLIKFPRIISNKDFKADTIYYNMNENLLAVIKSIGGIENFDV